MMARLGFYFQSGSIAVIFSAALACGSGNNTTADASLPTSGAGGTIGQSGSAGQQTTATGNTTGNDPIKTATGGTNQPVGPVCGDDHKDDGEVCDGIDLAGATCASLVPGNVGELSCEANCQNYNATMCYPEEVTEDTSTDAGGYGG